MDDATPARWEAIADNIWSLQYQFRNAGMQISTRMTVIRLADGSLVAHSAVPLTPEQRAQLDSFGALRYVIAPNAVHHLFLKPVLELYPQAQLYGPPRLLHKRPDLQGMQLLPVNALDAANTSWPWGNELQLLPFEGIPMMEETEFFHPATGSLLVTDALQCWQGPLSLPVRLYLGLTGGYQRLTVPRTVRLLVRDRKAVQRSACQLLQLPVQRVVLLHNSVLQERARECLAEALALWTADA